MHPVALSGACGFAGFSAFVAGLLIAHNDLPAATDAQVMVGGTLVAMAGFVGPVLRWWRGRMRWTQDEVRIETGAIWMQRRHVPTARLARLWIDQSTLGKALDYGTIWLEDTDGGVTHFGPTYSPASITGHLEAQLNRKGSKRRG